MLDDERRAHLLMAVATGEPLDASDQADLDQLFAADPTARTDLVALTEALGALPAAGTTRWTWDASPPPADLESKVLAATALPAALGAPGTGILTTGTPTAGRWRPALVAACAAALLAIGAGGGWGVAQLGEDGVPTGPPGTLGALEPVTFGAEPAGVLIDASVVAHTWGTETVFEVEGLEPGATYQVVVIGRDGAEVPAGTFLATDATVVCRMNAAVLRANAQAIAIRAPAGAEVLRAELPEVEVQATAGS